MHSLRLFVAITIFITLLPTDEAVLTYVFMEAVLKAVRTEQEKQRLAMNTTQKPILKNVTRIQEEDLHTYTPTPNTPADVQTNANTALEICIFVSPIILIALVLRKN